MKVRNGNKRHGKKTQRKTGEKDMKKLSRDMKKKTQSLGRNAEKTRRRQLKKPK